MKKKIQLNCGKKMSGIEIHFRHSNIADISLKRIRKYCGEKAKDITEEEKEKYKALFKGEIGIFVIEKRCKLPEAIELRKN